MRLKMLRLQDEITTLQQQISDRDSRYARLTDECERCRSQLEESSLRVLHQESQIRSLTTNLQSLKVSPFVLAIYTINLLTEIQEELHELSSVNHESAKYLSEKLALARQIAILKPELEHAKSQLAHQQGVLAEKLALQRQLDALEVELATERRAAQRALQKSSKEEPVEVKAAQRGTVKATSTRRGRDATIDIASQTTEATPQSKVARAGKRIEERTHELGNSTQEAGDDTNEYHDVSEQTPEKPAGKSKPPVAFSKKHTKLVPTKTDAPAPKPAPRKGKKRAINADESIVGLQTPEAHEKQGRALKRKRGLEITGMVEKSTFSITPFLNRTKSIGEGTADDSDQSLMALGAKNGSCVSEVDVEAVDGVGERSRKAPGTVARKTKRVLTEAPIHRAAMASKPDVDSHAGPGKTGVLVEASPSKRNVQPIAASVHRKVPDEKSESTTTGVDSGVEDKKVLRKTKQPEAEASKHKLKPTEETMDNAGKAKAARLEEERRPEAERDAAVEGRTSRNDGGKNAQEPISDPESGNTEEAPEPDQPQQKKARRKILSGSAAKTLFDEDGETDDTVPKRTTKAPLRLLSKAAPALGPAKRATGSAFGASAAFSPLKRDRRGVGASFLA